MRNRIAARSAWILLLIGLASWFGCGIKTRPRPPEDVRPEPIVDLRAKSVAKGIELAWSRPEHYQDGTRMRDLGEFVVLRGSDDGAPAELTTLPITDRERFQQQRRLLFLDSGALMNHRYRYRVISRTTDGYESVPSNEAMLTRTLPPPEPDPEHFTFPPSATKPAAGSIDSTGGGAAGSHPVQ